MFHITDQGNPAACVARPGNCLYGADAPHFETAEEARAAYESTQALGKSLTKSIRHEMSLSADVTKVLDQLHAAGLTPYVIGGSVRDSLFSHEVPKDIDIEIFGLKDMDELEKVLDKHKYNYDAVGRSFGVLKLQVASGEDLDLSLPRKDSKVGDGHKGFEVVVDPTLSLEDAAGRRDFTINTLYYSAKDNKVKDFFGGVEDWEKNELRHINEHFVDDPLRVIRGIQFAARFKMKLAPETAALTRSMVDEIPKLSNERIQTEFEKLFSKGTMTYGVATLHDSGWAPGLGLAHVDQSDAVAADAAIKRAKSLGEDPGVFGAAKLMAKAPVKARRKLSDTLLTGLKRQQKSEKLIEKKAPAAHDELSVRRWARELEREGVTPKDFYIYNGDEALRSASEKFGVFEKADKDLVTGALVLEKSGANPGPWIGKLIREANQAQDDGVFKSQKAADSWLEEKLKTTVQS